MAPHASALAWETPWAEEPGGPSPWGRQESDTTDAAQDGAEYLFFSHLKIIERL